VSVDAYGIGLRAGETLLAALAAREAGDTVGRGKNAAAPTARAKAVKIEFTVIPRESA
jgi:LacI family gluconate utilization system Gnt-I transcriptional repressor